MISKSLSSISIVLKYRCDKNNDNNTSISKKVFKDINASVTNDKILELSNAFLEVLSTNSIRTYLVETSYLQNR